MMKQAADLARPNASGPWIIEVYLAYEAQHFSLKLLNAINTLPIDGYRD
jgi:hypothetical protein